MFVTTESYEGAPAGEWVEVTTDETSCQIADLTPGTKYDWEVKGIKGEEESTWASSTFTTMEAPFIVLANDEDNTSLIESLDGEKGYDVQLADRTLFKDGSWNTLCLPFDVTIAGSVLDGADVRALNNVTLEGETVLPVLILKTSPMPSKPTLITMQPQSSFLAVPTVMQSGLTSSIMNCRKAVP